MMLKIFKRDKKYIGRLHWCVVLTWCIKNSVDPLLFIIIIIIYYLWIFIQEEVLVRLIPHLDTGVVHTTSAH